MCCRVAMDTRDHQPRPHHLGRRTKVAAGKNVARYLLIIDIDYIAHAIAVGQGRRMIKAL